MTTKTDTLLDAFSPFRRLSDPRDPRGVRHKMLDIVVVALCGTICGVDNADELQEFGEAKKAWFSTFLELPHGIPSQDTFLRVFALLDPDEFRGCFVEWVESLRSGKAGGIVAVDGKSLRRAFDAARDGMQVHMVNAWLQDEGLVLGSLRTASKSNEITAIPKLLQLLNIEGCTVTTDAMGCQRKITEAIVKKKADYVLQVADNHPTMHSEIIQYFGWANSSPEAPTLPTFDTVEKGHGRIEERCYQIANDVDWFEDRANWCKLNSFVRVTSKRTMVSTGESSEESRYYISSYSDNDAERAAKAVRRHWGAENELHWVLDMAFDEDRSRIRTKNAAENFAIIRQAALNLLKRETTKKKGIQTKRKRCGWDHDYLLKVIGLQ